ncbi:mucosal addressin cell adhesion molecule 1 [Pelobates fuscus]|uniref:mucosal addressin cell adhesion molecule 1 n=1 Tax=Pelobates fuscus TaxID=191477 RepID=UPI002FE47018
MAQTCRIVLQMALLCTARTSLNVLPQDPIVPVGGTVQLNCTINCHGGSTTWKGLDTNLAGLVSGIGYSLLTIENASISMGGYRICVGMCPGKRLLQRKVHLQVYALPQSLQVTSHTKEQPPTLRCSMYGLYPHVPVKLTWYRGQEKLMSASDNEDITENGELFNVKWSLEIPAKKIWAAGTTYRCEAEVTILDQVFKRQGTLQLEDKAKSTTRAILLASSETTGIPTTISGRPHGASTMELSTWKADILRAQRSSTPQPECTKIQPNPTTSTNKEPVTQAEQMGTKLSATFMSIHESRNSATNSLKSNKLLTFTTPLIIPRSSFIEEKSTYPPSVYQGTLMNIYIKVNLKDITTPSESIGNSIVEETSTPIIPTGTGITMPATPSIIGTPTIILGSSKVASSALDTTTTHGTQGRSTAQYELKASQRKHKIESATQKHFNTPTTTGTEPVTRLFSTLRPFKDRTLITNYDKSNPTWQFTSSVTHTMINPAQEKPTRSILNEKLRFTWIWLPTLGLTGSILLSFQLWRRLNRKGSFQFKQP